MQLDSPSKVGSSKAKWNVQPSIVATANGEQNASKAANGEQNASKAAVPTKQAGSKEIVTQTRRSTRSCKRKG